MELRHLQYFVAVAEAGSVLRAAERLGLTQPALSRQIRVLETELGVRLFDRVGRRIQLTAEGADLLRHSRELLVSAAALTDRARALLTGDAGILRVGASPQTMESVLATFLPRYRRAHPAVEFQLVSDGGAELLRRLDRGEIQLSVSISGEAFYCRFLFPARLLAVMAPSHPLVGRGALEIARLAKEPLLLLRREFASRRFFDVACDLAHMRARVGLETGSAQTLIALARAGYGVAVVPSTVLCGSKVHVAPLIAGGQTLGQWLGINWDPRRFLPRHAFDFIDALRARTQTTYPGQEFDRIAPLSRPPDRTRR
jgi:LysR family transcriptional regulator, cyn operon transcriptional activator